MGWVILMFQVFFAIKRLIFLPILYGETLGCARHLLLPTVNEASRGGGPAIRLLITWRISRVLGSFVFTRLCIYMRPVSAPERESSCNSFHSMLRIQSLVFLWFLGPIFELESVEFSNKLDDLIRLPRVLANKFRGLWFVEFHGWFENSFEF
jgi:hypothetical protein